MSEMKGSGFRRVGYVMVNEFEEKIPMWYLFERLHSDEDAKATTWDDLGALVDLSAHHEFPSPQYFQKFVEQFPDDAQRVYWDEESREFLSEMKNEGLIEAWEDAQDLVMYQKMANKCLSDRVRNVAQREVQRIINDIAARRPVPLNRGLSANPNINASTVFDLPRGVRFLASSRSVSHVFFLCTEGTSVLDFTTARVMVLPQIESLFDWISSQLKNRPGIELLRHMPWLFLMQRFEDMRRIAVKVGIEFARKALLQMDFLLQGDSSFVDALLDVGVGIKAVTVALYNQRRDGFDVGRLVTWLHEIVPQVHRVNSSSSSAVLLPPPPPPPSKKASALVSSFVSPPQAGVILPPPAIEPQKLQDLLNIEGANVGFNRLASMVSANERFSFKITRVLDNGAKLLLIAFIKYVEQDRYKIGAIEFKQHAHRLAWFVIDQQSARGYKFAIPLPREPQGHPTLDPLWLCLAEQFVVVRLKKAEFKHEVWRMLPLALLSGMTGDFVLALLHHLDRTRLFRDLSRLGMIDPASFDEEQARQVISDILQGSEKYKWKSVNFRRDIAMQDHTKILPDDLAVTVDTLLIREYIEASPREEEELDPFTQNLIKLLPCDPILKLKSTGGDKWKFHPVYVEGQLIYEPS